LHRRTQQFLDKIKVPKNVMDREVLISVARTSLRTKIARKLADPLTEQVVDAVRTIQRPDTPIDLFMVEILQMIHKSEPDTTLVRYNGDTVK
jgi:T-complex protein 1 subunit zeta